MIWENRLTSNEVSPKGLIKVSCVIAGNWRLTYAGPRKEWGLQPRDYVKWKHQQEHLRVLNTPNEQASQSVSKAVWLTYVPNSAQKSTWENKVRVFPSTSITQIMCAILSSQRVTKMICFQLAKGLWEGTQCFQVDFSPYLTVFKPAEFSFKAKTKNPEQLPHSIIKSRPSAFLPLLVDRSRNNRFCLDRVALFNQHKYFHRKISQRLYLRWSLRK